MLETIIGTILLVMVAGITIGVVMTYKHHLDLEKVDYVGDKARDVYADVIQETMGITQKMLEDVMTKTKEMMEEI